MDRGGGLLMHQYFSNRTPLSRKFDILQILPVVVWKFRVELSLGSVFDVTHSISPALFFNTHAAAHLLKLGIPHGIVRSCVQQAEHPLFMPHTHTGSLHGSVPHARMRAHAHMRACAHGGLQTD